MTRQQLRRLSREGLETYKSQLLQRATGLQGEALRANQTELAVVGQEEDDRRRETREEIRRAESGQLARAGSQADPYGGSIIRRADANQPHRDWDDPEGLRNRRGGHEHDETEIRSFAEYCRTGHFNSDVQRRTLGTTSASIGGALVPLSISQEIVQDLMALENVRAPRAAGVRGAQVRSVEGPTNVPTINDPVALRLTEVQTDSGISDTDPSFGAIELRPELLVCRTQIKWALLNRSAVDLANELRQAFSRAIAKKENDEFYNGTGTNMPQGICVGGSVGATAASTSTFTMAEVDQVAYSLGTEYFNDAVWVVSPSAAQILRSLETDEGVPYVRPDRADGLDRLHGRPLIVDSYMPAVETDSVPLFFGSLNAGYLIAEEKDLVVLTDPYSRSKFGEVVLSVYKFGDGRIRRSDAFKTLQMADGL